MKAPIPPNESDRLKTLAEYQLLDTRSEASFDKLVEIAATACETPIALLSLIDENRQWFKARVGLEAQETDREISFCAHAIASDAALIIDDAAQDPRFAENPLVTDQPGVRFYAGVPVHARNGQALGTLCVIDHEPRTLLPNQRRVLDRLAHEIEARFEIRRKAIEKRILVEERTVLTNMILHDAAGVMTALGWNLKLLEDRFVAGDDLLETAQESIDELMLHCKEISELHVEESRGLIVSPQVSNLESWFQEAVTYTKSVAERAGIEVQSQFEIRDAHFSTDTQLLLRMIRSLCRNAIDTCERGHTITLLAHLSLEGEFCLAVENNGTAISPDEEQRMFDPYFSGRASAPRNSGLELAFCRLAARALGGSIEYSRGESSGGRMLVKLPQMQTAH